MIILKDIRCKYLKSVQVELPRANMVIDPRPIWCDNYDHRFRCEYHDNGTTVTLTRTHNNKWNKTFSFRVYDPTTETVPSFESEIHIYTYMGEDDEYVPEDTTVLIIHPSVTVIKEGAFYDCSTIKKCIMHDGVHTIEEGAFYCCDNLKTIRLSRSLTRIGAEAFLECYSLEAVFLPPSVKKIDEAAFLYCSDIRIFTLPFNIDISEGIQEGIVGGCDNFFQATQIQESCDDDDEEREYQKIIDFYRKQVSPLHKACLDTHVTHQTIQQCVNTHGPATASITDHDGMTPLHILAMNPHADISALLACFDLNMSGAFVGDSRGNTPLDYLRVHHDSIEDHTSLVYKLCEHRDAATRSSQDSQETSTKRKRVN